VNGLYINIKPLNSQSPLRATATKSTAMETHVCAHCGKVDLDMKRCSICKDTWYCGHACSRGDWKQHKKICKPPPRHVPVEQLMHQMQKASDRGLWHEVVKSEHRMAEMIATTPDAVTLGILTTFMNAHEKLSKETGDAHHLSSCDQLQERKIELLGAMNRFRDQGEEMYSQGSSLLLRKYEKGNPDVGRIERDLAEKWFKRTRAVAEQHGFFTLESEACFGLGKLSVNDDRVEEGIDLIKNAYIAGDLDDSVAHASQAVELLIELYIQTHQLDDAVLLIPKYGELAKKSSYIVRVLAELVITTFKARINQVRCFHV
jgi:hypothetical protein